MGYRRVTVTLRCPEGFTLHQITLICWHCGSLSQGNLVRSFFRSSPECHRYVIQDFSYIFLVLEKNCFPLANWMHDMFCDGALGVRIVGISLVVDASVTVGYVAFTNVGEEWFVWWMNASWAELKIKFVFKTFKTTRWVLKQVFNSWLVISIQLSPS